MAQKLPQGRPPILRTHGVRPFGKHLPDGRIPPNAAFLHKNRGQRGGHRLGNRSEVPFVPERRFLRAAGSSFPGDAPGRDTAAANHHGSGGGQIKLLTSRGEKIVQQHRLFAPFRSGGRSALRKIYRMEEKRAYNQNVNPPPHLLPARAFGLFSSEILNEPPAGLARKGQAASPHFAKQNATCSRFPDLSVRFIFQPSGRS